MQREEGDREKSTAVSDCSGRTKHLLVHTLTLLYIVQKKELNYDNCHLEFIYVL